MLHRYLAIEGNAPTIHAADLEGVRVPSGIPKPLTEAQVTSLLDAVIGNEPVHRRDRALLELLHATGARISEAVGLSIGDIDFDASLVRLYGKGARNGSCRSGRRPTALEDWFGAVDGYASFPIGGSGATTPRRSSSTPAAGA